MEKYLEDLPIKLQKNLIKLGFVLLKKKQINQLCRLSEELLAFCHMKAILA